MKRSKEEIKQLAKDFLKNPESDKAKETVWALCMHFAITPQQVFNRIQQLAND